MGFNVTEYQVKRQHGEQADENYAVVASSAGAFLLNQLARGGSKSGDIQWQLSSGGPVFPCSAPEMCNIFWPEFA